MTTTTVFQSGHSQAVRIPRGFRFAVRRVSIRKEGEAVVLEPLCARAWPKGLFTRIRIADPRFQRPAQGDASPGRPLDADLSGGTP